MHKLMIDLETRSDADITKTGVYRYADSPYFDILLFAYSVDDAPVKVIDLASGESLPDDILHALTDDSVTKHSFNASFERVCLSVWRNAIIPIFSTVTAFHRILSAIILVLILGTALWQRPLTLDCR